MTGPRVQLDGAHAALEESDGPHAEMHDSYTAHRERARGIASGTLAFVVVVAALLLAVVMLGGCSAAQQATVKADAAIAVSDANVAATAALGGITAALEDPAALELAKSLLASAAQKVDPKVAPSVVAALAHVNAGNLQEAQTIARAVVSATASPSSSTVASAPK